MTAFSQVSHILQGILFSWAFLSFVIAMACLTVSVSYKVKRGSIILLSVITVIEAVALCLGGNSYCITKEGAPPTLTSAAFGNIPLFAVSIYVVLTFVFAVFYSVRLVGFIRKHITATSVKESMDKLPTGLCFYAKNGLPLLVNHTMAYVCMTATGSALLNGAEFWDAVACGRLACGNEAVRLSSAPIIKLSDGTVKSFVRKELADGVFEITACDVTEKYALSETLDEKNKRLAEVNARLREYGGCVTEFTREKETLAAKVRIHDGLGKLLLSAKKQIICGGDRQALLDEFRQSNVLLFSEDEGTDFDGLLRSADTVGVKISLDGNLPDDKAVRRVFLTAIHECLTNTVSHADGQNLFVAVSDGNGYVITCTNDGNLPCGEITEGGGLTNLRRLTEKENGTMTVETMPEFKLTVIIPKRSEND